MSYEAGTAFLQVVPSFAGVVDAITSEFTKDGDIAGETFRTAFEETARDMKATVGLDTRTADEKLAELKLEISNLHESVGVDVSDSEALAKVGFLKAELDSLHGSIDIKTGTDLAGELDAIAKAADDASGNGNGGGLLGLANEADSSLGAISPMIPALVLLGTALIPIAGLAAGALSTLPAIFAGAGTGIGALYLGLSGILPAISAYEATLNNTGKTAAQVATEHRNLLNAMAGLTPAGQTFVAFVASQLLPIFSGLKNAVQAALLPGITAGLQALVPVFQALIPFIVQAGQGIGGFVSALGSILGSGAGVFNLAVIFQAGAGFMKQLADATLQFVPALLTISAQASPILKAIGDGVEGIVSSFAKWVANGGFESFVHWLQANGPAIVKDLEDFVGGILKLVIALTPVGVVMLHVVGLLGEFIGWLTKFPGLLGGAIAVLGGFGLALAIAMDSNPIGLIVTAIAFLVIGIVELWTHWTTVWGEIKHVFDDAVTFLRSGFGSLVLLITGPFAPLLLLALHWQQVWSEIQSVTETVWQFLENDIIHPLVNFFTVTVPGALNTLGRAFATAWGVIDDDFLKPLKTALLDVIGVITIIFVLPAVLAFQALSKAATDAWSLIWNDALSPLVNALSVVVGPAVQTLVGIFSSAWSLISGAVGAAWSWINTNVLQPMVTFFTVTIGGTISTMLGFFESIPGRIGGALATVFSTITGAFGDVAGWVGTNIITPVENLFGGIGKGISTAMGDVGGVVSGIFKTAWDGIARVWNDTVGGLGFTIPSWVPGLGGDGFTIPKMPILHEGGIVPGPAGADVPAILQAGELVVSRPDLAALTASGGSSEPTRIYSPTFEVQAFDPQSAAIIMQQRSDFAAKTRGF